MAISQLWCNHVKACYRIIRSPGPTSNAIMICFYLDVMSQIVRQGFVERTRSTWIRLENENRIGARPHAKRAQIGF